MKVKKTNAMRILDRSKVPYQLVPYTYDPEDLNVSRIAEENGLDLAMVFKTLVLKGDKQGVFVTVIPGDKELNMKSAAQQSGNKKAYLLPIKDLEKTIGYIRGGCSPIGMKRNYPVLVDIAAENLETIYINAGTRGLLIGLAPADLLRMTESQGIFYHICS